MSPPPPMLANLAVVVLSHNRREELLPNLQLLLALQIMTGFELIVVDNASSDGTPAELSRLREQHPDLILVLSDVNLGVAGGRNLGWSRATRNFILNLDDDTRIDLEAMLAMYHAAASSERIGIVTPKVVHALTGECQNGYAGDVSEPANFHGACHLVRRSLWTRIGELDAQCSFGGEELDYTIRARAAEFKTICLAQVTVRHNSKIRAGKPGRSRQEQWVYNYTRVLFKHFPLSRAALLAGRNFASHLASGAVAHGPIVALSLLSHTIQGALAGRRRYAALPPQALGFYAREDLLPDFGNVPLSRKLLARIRRRGA